MKVINQTNEHVFNVKTLYCINDMKRKLCSGNVKVIKKKKFIVRKELSFHFAKFFKVKYCFY